jgi:hypothetical protein
VRKDAGARSAYQQGTGLIQNQYILNYNHTVDVEIFFAFDSDSVTAEAADELDVIGRALTSPELRGAMYLLAGHTDAKGEADYNHWLSERRAHAAKRYLVEKFPIDPDRLVPVGFGETALRDPGRPRSGVNRRVEVTLIERDGGPNVSQAEPPVVGTGTTTGNIVCDTAPAVLEDPRPVENGLDDFGGRRTPVECADQHDQREPDAAISEEVVEESSLNEAIGN